MLFGLSFLRTLLCAYEFYLFLYKMAAKESELSIGYNPQATSVPAENTIVASLTDEVNELVKHAGSPSNSLYTFQEELIVSDASGSVQTPFFPRVPTANQNIHEIMARYKRTPNDTNDPSYTHLTLPYSVVCRQRYRNAARLQRAYFIKEIRAHELLRMKALDGVRIHREFCNPIISPVKPTELITLTNDQKEKLEKILSSP